MVSYLICRVSCCDRNNNITASLLHPTMTARATSLTYSLRLRGCPRTDLPPTALQPWSARRRAASEGRRRPVRSAAARRSARARQPQDDAMTPAGPTDRTSAPSRASRCACVAGVLSHLGGAGRLLLLPRTRRAAERAPRPIDRHMAARCVKRGYRGLAPLRWRREERRPAEHLAASCSWIPRARGEPPGPRHARRLHCLYRERS